MFGHIFSCCGNHSGGRLFLGAVLGCATFLSPGLKCFLSGVDLLKGERREERRAQSPCPSRSSPACCTGHMQEGQGWPSGKSSLRGEILAARAGSLKNTAYVCGPSGQDLRGNKSVQLHCSQHSCPLTPTYCSAHCALQQPHYMYF